MPRRPYGLWHRQPKGQDENVGVGRCLLQGQPMDAIELDMEGRQQSNPARQRPLQTRLRFLVSVRSLETMGGPAKTVSNLGARSTEGRAGNRFGPPGVLPRPGTSTEPEPMTIQSRLAGRKKFGGWPGQRKI